jgi:hypothetical protein
MNPVRPNTKISGILIFVGFIAGILSVAPVADSTEYLSKTAENANQIINGAVFQFIMALAYLGFALFYILMIKSKLIPLWLSIWGAVGALLSVLASLLVLFGSIDIITSGYIILNIPSALLELVLALWLIIKGFDKSIQY